MEHGLFFPSASELLYGFVHPATPAAGPPRATGVVFVHGAFEERQDAHRVVRDAAAQLAAKGYASLRFDLSGHGDSTGDFAQARLDRWVADAVTACDVLRAHTRCARVALVGLRLGAVVAVRAARALAAPPPLVLWQPVVGGRAYALDVLRAHLASEMVAHRRGGGTRDALVARLRAGESVNVQGYRLAPELFADLLAADLAADLAALSGRPGARPAATAGDPAGPALALLIDVVRGRAARGVGELAALAAAVGPTVALERVVEAQALHAEGKLFCTRADGVVAATARFLAQGAA